MLLSSAILPKQLRTSFLNASSRLYELACPNLGRTLTSKARDSNHEAPRQHCIHCHSPLQPSLCRVKLSPRPRITREIERLKKKLDRDASLTSAQKKKLKRWINSKNVLVICCRICKKTNRIPCAKRSDRPQYSLASDSNSFQDSVSKKRKRRSASTNPFTASSSGSFVSPPSKKQKRHYPSSNISVTISPALSIPGRSVHSYEVNPSPSGRSSRSAKKDKYRQLQTMLKSAKQEQETNQSPLSKFLTSL